MTLMAVAVLFSIFAALVHVYIFVVESLTWTSPRTRAVFGTTAEEAQTTKMLAFNQGFYNLFLAVVAGTGIAMVLAGQRSVGAALMLAAVGSMLAAALVLLASAPDKARAAVTQGAFPLIAVIALAAALV